MNYAAIPHEFFTFALLVGSRTGKGCPATLGVSPIDRGSAASQPGQTQKFQDALGTIAAGDPGAAYPTIGGAYRFEKTLDLVFLESPVPVLRQQAGRGSLRAYLASRAPGLTA